MKKKIPPAVYGGLLLTGVNLFSQILAFAYRVWLSRLVGPETLGLYSLVMPVYSVVMSLCVSGLTVAVSRMTAAFAARGNTLAMEQTVRAARKGYIIMLTALAAVTVPLSDQISVHLLGDARTRLGLLLLLPCIALTGWENIHKNYFYGRKNVIPPATSEVLEQSVRTAVILGLLYHLMPVHHELQVGLIITGMIASEVVSSILLTLFYRKDRLQRVQRENVQRENVQHENVQSENARRDNASGGRELPDIRARILKIALPVGAAGVLSSLIGSLGSIIIPGRLIVSGMEPSQALSAFGVAFGMTMPLLGLPLAFTVAISLVMLPRLAESAALGDMAAIKRRVRSALLISMCVVALFTSFLIPFGRPIAQALFRNPDAGSFMIPLAIATVFVCFEQILGSFLNGLGAQRKTAVNFITAGLLQLALTWWGVAQPELRLYGYVLAYLAGNILGTALCALDLAKILQKKDARELRAVDFEPDSI